MVDFNWRIDVVCATVLLPLNFIKSWYIEWRVTSILFVLAVNPFWNSKYCLVASILFSQTSGVIPGGFTIFFVRGGRESLHPFCSPRMVLNPCSSSLRKRNACTVCFFKYFAVIEAVYLFSIMLGRLNARTRFRAIAEAPIPLSSISLGGMSQPVDRELQPVRI